MNGSCECAKTVIYAGRPLAAMFMSRLLGARNRWAQQQRFPDLRLVWRGYAVKPGEVDQWLTLAGVTDRRPNSAALLLAPHVTGFRLSMAMLTHPSWPIPIWRALQVRNRLLLQGRVGLGEPFDLVTDVSGWRTLEKGIEVDVRTRLQRGEETPWQSVVTFYYRGSYEPGLNHGEAHGAPALSPKIDDQAKPSARWRVDPAGKWAFGTLTGDYNPIHQWDWYARLMGFHGASAHAQRIVARSLSQWSFSGDQKHQLDVWIKGPVYFGAEVVQRQLERSSGEGGDVGVWMADDPRPALIGRWTVIRGGTI